MIQKKGQKDVRLYFNVLTIAIIKQPRLIPTAPSTINQIVSRGSPGHLSSFSMPIINAGKKEIYNSVTIIIPTHFKSLEHVKPSSSPMFLCQVSVFSTFKFYSETKMK